MVEKPHKQMNGIKIVSKDELHSFLAFARGRMVGSKKWKKQLQLTISIPQEVIRFLELVRDDLLLVAIRKATDNDIKEYKE